MPESPKPGRRRIVRRHQPADGGRGQPSLFSLRPGELWRLLKSYVGLEGHSRRQQITDRAGLANFLETRASYIAQASLYGYLRTRAGMRYPELFDDDPFVEAINIAKWQVWLACLADIAVYAGGCLAKYAPHEAPRVAALLPGIIGEILDRTGVPAEAGAEFSAGAAQVRDRLARTDWLSVGDGEAAFSASPDALIHWAPIMDELKQLDETIVRNSVRFRWQEVRRDFIQDLDARSVLGLEPAPTS